MKEKVSLILLSKKREKKKESLSNIREKNRIFYILFFIFRVGPSIFFLRLFYYFLPLFSFVFLFLLRIVVVDIHNFWSSSSSSSS